MARRRQRIDRGIRVRSDSIYALASPLEIAYLVVPRALFAGLLLALPLLLAARPYWGRVFLSALLMALLAVAFDFLAHHVGLVCLGGAFFFGVGGYAAALLSREAGLSPALSIPLATLAGAAFCSVAIAPCLRLSGIYFAVVTLMLPLLAVRLIEATDAFGGTEGMRGVAGFSSPWLEPYALVAVLLAALFALRRFATAPAGLVLRAIRDNDQAVRAAGISVGWRRVQALFLAALLGCFAGAVYTHLYRGVGVSAFALDLSIIPIAATVIGGPGTLIGPVLGSLILVPLGELLRDFGSLRIVAYALLLTGFVVLRSEGLLPWATRKYQQIERWVEV